MTIEHILTFTHATERDVDLLLVEELKCSPAFARWLTLKVAGATSCEWPFDRVEVVHSHTRVLNRREIDIELRLYNGKTRRILLIENKLREDEQPGQGENYREECDSAVARGEAKAAACVLIAPERYLGLNTLFAAKFDAVVTYEDVRDFLASHARTQAGELASRLDHRRDLFEQAIGALRRGYKLVVRPEVGTFNKDYIALVREECPELLPGPSMLSGANPGGSVTMIFAPQTLPDWPFLPQTRLVHQLREANANANFYRWGNHLGEIAGELSKDLSGTGYRVTSTLNKRKDGNSGLMIFTATPKVDNKAPFATQHAAILAGIQEADKLRRWILANRGVLERWATVIERAAKRFST